MTDSNDSTHQLVQQMDIDMPRNLSYDNNLC